jgi:mono-ADP-ribosyltransferase sirtuin 6
MATSAPKIAEEERIEAAAAVEKKAEILASLIRGSKHFIAFTGAGISTPAGKSDS